uniref:Uncharacterized protein n=1 Tax=Heterorhabditis bacteriophora TaxID=37862 RepID=A0A1I7WTZ1_HETBA
MEPVKAAEVNQPPPSYEESTSEIDPATIQHVTSQYPVHIEQNETSRPIVMPMFVTARTSVYGACPVEMDCPHCQVCCLGSYLAFVLCLAFFFYLFPGAFAVFHFVLINASMSFTHVLFASDIWGDIIVYLGYCIISVIVPLFIAVVYHSLSYSMTFFYMFQSRLYTKDSDVPHL